MSEHGLGSPPTCSTQLASSCSQPVLFLRRQPPKRRSVAGRSQRPSYLPKKVPGSASRAPLTSVPTVAFGWLSSNTQIAINIRGLPVLVR